MRWTPLALASILIACSATRPEGAGTAPPPSAPKPAKSTVGTALSVVKLTADTAEQTHTLASFIAPAGWTLETEGPRQRLIAPEPNLRVDLVEVEAPSAREAASAAWSRTRADFARTVKVDQSEPARDGWEEVHSISYETSPNEQLLVQAITLRLSKRWLVLAIESGLASMAKQQSAYGLFLDSVRPQGYVRESFAGKQAAVLDAARVAQILEVVEAGRKALEIPGVALTLVQNGKVVYAGGLGVRELGKPAPVDADTRFLVASNTKALTTLLLALQVDAGKYTWDTPVKDVLPGFRLGDAATTEKVLVRHLVCACTGLPRQDMEWLFEYGKATSASALSVLAACQPTSAFGETFQYSNLMAGAAGFVAGHVAYPAEQDLGVAYDRAMTAQVFRPLGMKDTTFDLQRAVRGNFARPHAQDVKGVMRVAALGLDVAVTPIRPAGGAWSTARDLTQYVQLELARGKLPNGKPLVSEANLVARAAPQVRLGETATYGMGLMVESEWSVDVVRHGGDLPGYHSDMFWLPEYGVGGVILTNGEAGWALRGPFVRRTLEVLFDGKPEALEDVMAAAASEKAWLAEDRARLVFPPEAELTQGLAAQYHNEQLGSLHIVTRDGQVLLDVGEWQSEIASRRNEDGTRSIHTVSPGLHRFRFLVGERDGKRALILRDDQHEYVFLEQSLNRTPGQAPQGHEG